MSYEPTYTISPRLLSLVEEVTALRERIQGAAIELSWNPPCTRIPANLHSSTAIGGNPLTLKEVRALEKGRGFAASNQRSQREVLNYFTGLRYVENHTGKDIIRHEDLFKLYRILAGKVMDQGDLSGRETLTQRKTYKKQKGRIYFCP